MIVYWDISTGAATIIKRFISFIDENNFSIGDEIIRSEEEDKKILVNKNGQKFHTFTSKSTCNQYLKTWEALGLIAKNKSAYRIATLIRDYKLLCFYTLLFLVQDSNDERVLRYRHTIIINILFAAKIINSKDLYDKGIKKTRDKFKISNIQKNVSKYEKKLAKHFEIAKWLKEHYDQKL